MITANVSLHQAPQQAHFLAADALQQLVEQLRYDGYTVIAPVRQDHVINLAPVEHADQIARDLTDEQDGGHYRLLDSPGTYFEYVVGQDSPKRWFFPPRQKLFALHIEGKKFVMDDGPPQPPRVAFLGIRPCDLAAINVQDRVFGITPDQQTFRCESETYYRTAREQSLLIVVNCTRPGGTCFCASHGTGPAVNDSHHAYDLSMTPLRAGFILRAASNRGQELVHKLTTRPPNSAELELENLKLHQSREHMGRSLNTLGLLEAMNNAVEHPRWDEIAQRCLSCGNCTMVCPTCFCSTVVDSNNLTNTSFTRTRHWESCFTHQFSYTTAGPVRNTIRGRYRQWMRHKLCTWWEQFGTTGCVGCGRCITWCPVGIDITAEAAIIRNHQPAPAASEAGL